MGLMSMARCTSMDVPLLYRRQLLPSLLKLIRLGGDVNGQAATGFGQTALQAAAIYDRASHVKLLVDKYSAVVNAPRTTRIPTFSALEAGAYYTANQGCGTGIGALHY